MFGFDNIINYRMCFILFYLINIIIFLNPLVVVQLWETQIKCHGKETDITLNKLEKILF